ncbi:hypothetical protein AGMMS49991_11140 [Spirochaetia bacterium]|nr:hypothetical protein AGMMS49991_11140 [Spirochaetia bacterium]
MVALIDTNVIIDYLTQRVPFIQAAVFPLKWCVCFSYQISL